MSASPALSIVIPVYNEESIVEQAAAELTRGLDERGWDYEIIFALDPSPDRTEEVILEERGRDERAPRAPPPLPRTSRQPSETASSVWSSACGRLPV